LIAGNEPVTEFAVLSNREQRLAERADGHTDDEHMKPATREQHRCHKRSAEHQRIE
jgi:hypothetical protein